MKKQEKIDSKEIKQALEQDTVMTRCQNYLTGNFKYVKGPNEKGGQHARSDG